MTRECFFCFKQKTAYEMRISDWSSDVCSSDLTLRRLPGLSVANDQGEGRYLTVRGVSPDLLNVTLNGETAAAPEPTSRQVKLDDIPSGLIGAVTVVKTLTPDLDANAIAGSAQLETLTAFDRDRRSAHGRAADGARKVAMKGQG